MVVQVLPAIRDRVRRSLFDVQPGEEMKFGQDRIHTISINLWNKLATDEIVQSLELYVIDTVSLRINTVSIIRNHIPGGNRWMNAVNGYDYMHHDGLTFETRSDALDYFRAYLTSKIENAKWSLENFQRALDRIDGK